jgi:hypothetical protein
MDVIIGDAEPDKMVFGEKYPVYFLAGRIKDMPYKSVNGSGLPIVPC